ncbi:MAG TPA: hypothetical protein VFV87_11405 [Pirellulaceae bacterium]|nr:hypothetical protein [Pirellulaceae bacterium]
MRFGLTLSAVVCFAPAGAALADDAPKLEIAAGAAVRFASVEEGRTVLQSDDAFTRSLSPFDLQSRMKSAEKVQLEAWKDFVAQHVRPWEEEDVKAVTESVTRLSKRLAKYRLPLPKEIVLVRTSGEEEGNAAYTRGTAIVLPDKVLKYSPQQLDRLLTHELLHILSRHDGALRQRLYRIVGFEVCDPIAMPESLAPRKITNPDAPLVDCVIELTADDGQTYTAAPVL